MPSENLQNAVSGGAWRILSITVNGQVRILIVEDERKLVAALQAGLQAESYSVSVAFTGEEGFYLANTETFDLMLLDVMLPGRDGMEILRSLRQRGIRTPALLLTARDAVEDRVLGLDSGADDYLVKPFAFPELLARIRALLRRGRPDAPAILKIHDVEMDMASRTVTRGGTRLDLTPREFDLLEYLVRNQGRVVSREMLARDIWKEPARHTPLDNVIDVHIARLRRKLDEPFEKKLLQTVRGVGFLVRE
jgi:two-component system copper resistance phosphate regulon response regulator CusR